jgi:hypothetical protein
MLLIERSPRNAQGWYQIELLIHQAAKLPPSASTVLPAVAQAVCYCASAIEMFPMISLSNARASTRFKQKGCVYRSVPELTCGSRIKLNSRLPLHRRRRAIAYRHRKFPHSGPTMARPSGDRIPPGGFVSLNSQSSCRRRQVQRSRRKMTFSSDARKVEPSLIAAP